MQQYMEMHVVYAHIRGNYLHVFFDIHIYYIKMLYIYIYTMHSCLRNKYINRKTVIYIYIFKIFL